MAVRRPYERVGQLARKLLWECGAAEPSKIDPFLIVAKHGIEVIYRRLDGATTRIFRHGDRAPSGGGVFYLSSVGPNECKPE